MWRKIIGLFKVVLTQGISPHKLALTVALGVVVGILPLLWGSTILCAFLAHYLRLNQPVIQAANYLTYPIQIALLVPFYRLGARIFPWGPAIKVPFSGAWHWNDFYAGFAGLAVATLKALAVWLVVAPPVAGVLYLLLLPAVRKIPAVRTSSM